MGVAEKNSGAPLPAKLAGLLREAKWLIVVAVAGYLLLIFATFHRGDPGWSRSVTDGVARNAGGVVGAWVSDVALYLFGLSAYWWVALCVYVIVWGYRRLDGTRLIDRRPLVLALAGFAILLVCSAALERLRLHSLSVELPLAPGGLIGNGVGELTGAAFGFTGATLVLLTLAAIGLSLFTGISWLAVAEVVGAMLEAGYGFVIRVRDRRRDRKLGVRAREERDFIVGAEKRREDEHPPLRIELPLAQIRQSERVHKEKQVPLFEDLPDTPLPPLKLLDDARPGGEQVTPETLEFTSRLIEKKLSDFGVAVKVIAAYPGPVITRYEVEPAVGVKGSQIVNQIGRAS